VGRSVIYKEKRNRISSRCFLEGSLNSSDLELAGKSIKVGKEAGKGWGERERKDAHVQQDEFLNPTTERS
jgi:hypothetical protein